MRLDAVVETYPVLGEGVVEPSQIRDGSAAVTRSAVPWGEVDLNAGRNVL